MKYSGITGDCALGGWMPQTEKVKYGSNVSRVGLLALVALSLVGCGDDTKPSRSAALEQIQETLHSDKTVTVSNLSYDNGRDPGDGSYIVTAGYDLTFLKSAHELLATVRNGSSIDADLGMASLRMKFGDWKAGQTFHDQQDYRFQKTEKGWLLVE